jgi:tetratricopeptide (TPR) repeat protein
VLLCAAGSARAEDADVVEAQETLRRARLYFDRGEFDRAVDAFDSILDRPVKLRTADDLHEGFLYYAFTLFLQGKEEPALRRLRIALEIDPDYVPSPVTTRPDLKAFYDEQREIFKDSPEGSSPRLLEQIFQELAPEIGAGRVVLRRAFVPFFGIGLIEMGHRRAGGFLLVTEVSSLAINVASMFMRGAVHSDRTPTGWTVTFVSRGLNYPSFAVFWTALVVDFVVSLALRRYYTNNKDKMPIPTPRRQGRVRPPPQVSMTPAGVLLRFW